MPRPLAPLLLAATLLQACTSLPEARMALPTDLAPVAPVPVSGIGGGRSGTFTAGPISGRFTRDDTRLAIFDPLYERRGGRVSATLLAPGEPPLAADCRLVEKTVTVAIVSATPAPMSMRCTLTRSGSAPGSLRLDATREGLAGMLQREGRRGTLEFGGTRIDVRSVHDVQGSPLQTATPIGYLFEQQGRPVGAVQLNGTPLVRLAPGTDAATARTLLVGATLLGLMWDPAQSPLGREAG